MHLRVRLSRPEGEAGMTPLEAVALQDVQALGDDRDIAIDAVGIAGLRYPITIADREGHAQRTVATVDMDVDLGAHVKGTHMSRFVEVLAEQHIEVSVTTVVGVARSLRQRLGSERARVALRFPYFRQRQAPVSGLPALVDCDATLAAEVLGLKQTVRVGVRVPVTSLCPCSKEISDYGAHSQRGYVDMSVECASPRSVWIEDLIDVAEASASAPIYPLLKRVDERHVTMQAYDNPAFVEDIVRDVAVALKGDERIDAFALTATNLESIHNHSAVGRLRWQRTP